MIAVIHTQVYENYGAHNWDGQGECPQYWKAKGGQVIKITDLPYNPDLSAIREMADIAFGEDSVGYREYVVDVSLESNDYLSQFEKSQVEYDGAIQYPEPVVKYADIYWKYYGFAEAQSSYDQDTF